MLRVKVKTDSALKNMQLINTRMQSLGPALSRVAADQITSTLKNFEVSGRPTKWAPLKAATLRAWIGRYKPGGAYRTKSGGLTKKGEKALGGRKPLIDTGHLWRSVRRGRIGPRSVEIQAGGGAAPYAGIHQFGGKRGPVTPKVKKALAGEGLPHPVKRVRGATIPARPFMVWLPEDLQRHEQTIRSYILTGG